jgi:hypothetical protein
MIAFEKAVVTKVSRSRFSVLISKPRGGRMHFPQILSKPENTLYVLAQLESYFFYRIESK